MHFIVITAVVFLLVGFYGWLRFGPKRCPKCGKLTMGVWGPPVGIRRMFFRCRVCGTRFEGHKRLPL